MKNAWITHICHYHEGFVCVQRKDEKWNYMNENGKLLSPNRWFQWTTRFINGFGAVQDDEGMWNFINKYGDIISPNQWFSDIRGFIGTVARVMDSNDNWGMIDAHGNIIVDFIFDCIIHKENFYIGFIDDAQYVIDTKSKIHKLLLTK